MMKSVCLIWLIDTVATMSGRTAGKVPGCLSEARQEKLASSVQLPKLEWPVLTLLYKPGEPLVRI